MSYQFVAGGSTDSNEVKKQKYTDDIRWWTENYYKDEDLASKQTIKRMLINIKFLTEYDLDPQYEKPTFLFTEKELIELDHFKFLNLSPEDAQQNEKMYLERLETLRGEIWEEYKKNIHTVKNHTDLEKVYKNIYMRQIDDPAIKRHGALMNKPREEIYATLRGSVLELHVLSAMETMRRRFDEKFDRDSRARREREPQQSGGEAVKQKESMCTIS